MSLLKLLTFGLSSCAQSYEERLARLYKYSVPQITPDSLHHLVEEKEPPLILDTRQPEEYAVSHIDGALLIDYDQFDPQMVVDYDRSKPVVVYCSVGYRSERIGEKLQEMGFENVVNLYGGIFQWKNEGFEVVDEAGDTTNLVHTYNRRWSKWLTNGKKIY